MDKLSYETRKIIVAKMLKVKRQSEVSRELRIGQTTVPAIWLKYEKTRSVCDMNRTDRPVKTSENERRLICQLSKKYPFMTVR